MEYKDFFSPSTLAKLNKQSAENLKQMLGDKTLMQTLTSSQQLLNQIAKAEAPYKAKLEKLAIDMVKEIYPIIDEEGIIIDAKIVSMSEVGSELDESISPESRRRIINAITQGAAFRGAFAFYLFKEHLDEIDPSLVEKYNQIMKASLGVYDDENAIAMFLSMLAQGQKMAGGSSKVILKEIKVNPPQVLVKGKKYKFKLSDGKTEEGTFDYKYGKGDDTRLVFKTNNGSINVGRKNILKTGGFHVIDEIKVNSPSKKVFIFKDDPTYGIIAGTYVVVGEDEDDYKLQNIKTKSFEFVSKYYAKNNQINKSINESQQSGITIKARAINFPMLVHEIVKGLFELISLQGFKGTKEQNQAVVDKVDLLKNEPYDFKYGKFIYDALRDVAMDNNASPKIGRAHV